MTIEVVVNNYQLGAKVRTTPAHKITVRERLDSKHTKLRYEDVTEAERAFIEKVLAKKTREV